MKVGSPLTAQFDFLYKQAMPPTQVTDTCVPTQWFGPMVKTNFPQQTTRTTWWNETQDGKPVINDGVAAFNYNPPPCRIGRTYEFDTGLSIFLFLGVLVSMMGGLFLALKRAQIVANLREEAVLEAVPTEQVSAPRMVTPPPRPASDTSEVDEIRSLAEPKSASGRKRD